MIAAFAKRSVLLASATILLAGCAVGPDFTRPEPPKDAGYSPKPLTDMVVSSQVKGGGTQRLVVGDEVPFEWWKLFKSPALNSLVAKAFTGNPDVAAAQAALRQAQEQVYAQQGYFFPTLTSGYSFERQELAGNSSSGPGYQGNGANLSTNQQATQPYNTPLYYNTHTSQLTLSFVPDIFGGNIRGVESLTAQAQIQRFSLQATYVTLASNVVAAAITEAGLRQQIEATQAIIAANTRMLDILKLQFQQGFAMSIDVANQEQALAQAQQLLPPLEKQFQQNRDLIRALVGNLPSEEVPEEFHLADLELPQNLPLSLPSKIIDQRPDVRAAEEALHSANANVGIAIANRLPQFAINGAQGGVAAQFSQMFSNGGPFWDIIGSVSQTVFDGNTLLHRERGADQALLQAAAQYRSTVLSAYQNVADTLHALDADAPALQAAVKAEKSAKVILDKTETQLKTGFVPPFVVLAAQQNYQMAVVNRAQAEANRFNDTAALFDALGGGWWNRTDLALDDQKNDVFLDWFNGSLDKWDTVRAR